MIGRRVRIAWVSALCVGLAGVSSAFPIGPQSLRKLCLDSELIVVARVVDVGVAEGDRPPIPDYYGLPPGLAVLEVERFLKGASARRVSVAYRRDVFCPRQPVYVKGTSVLAFLSGVDLCGDRWTVGLSYGVKRLSGRELDAHVAAIACLASVDAASDASERSARTAEWLLSCAERPATRRDALRELVRPSITRAEPRRPDFIGVLTWSQLDRVAALLGEERQTQCAVRLMSILVEATGDVELERQRRDFACHQHPSGRLLESSVDAFLARYQGIDRGGA